jgi:phosphoribosyl 1,2-cyclic phosphodiesterase
MRKCLGGEALIQFSLLGSGSSGNALLIKTDKTKVLVDCGLSYRQLRLRSAEVGESIDDLAGVIVTHEHGDHVNGLGVLGRQFKRANDSILPIYMTRGTYHNLPKSLGLLENVECFEPGESVTIGDIEAESFSVTHDAADPVSYVLRYEGTKLGIAADLGHATTLVHQRLAGSHGLILESNYCPEMLEKSSYPAQIRQRISSRSGHLSNHEMSSLLKGIAHEQLQQVVLIHISEENNTHELAKHRATQALGARSETVEVDVAPQDRPTKMFEVRS